MLLTMDYQVYVRPSLFFLSHIKLNILIRAQQTVKISIVL
jgi:hypothetical protein